MSTWEQAWNAATVEERKTVRRWTKGLKYRNGLNGDRNQCAACGEFFASSASFEKHRIGSFPKMERRCMSVPEMVGKGFERNVYFYWVGSPNQSGMFTQPELTYE